MDVPAVDFFAYMDGIWKRNLEWRHFGKAYQHLRTSNTLIQINKHAAKSDGRKFLTWSFGLDLKQTSMKFGYVMKLEPSVSVSVFPFAVALVRPPCVQCVTSNVLHFR